MGLFYERQKEKARLEEEMLAESVYDLSRAVMGDRVSYRTDSKRLRELRAIEDLGSFLNIGLPYSADSALTMEWYQETFFRPQGIMWRTVRLEGKWYEQATGIMLGALEDGTSVALVPMGTGGYSFRDPATGKRIRITKANAGRFHTEAVLYYRALPARRIDSDDIRQFALRSVSASELILLLSATLAAVLLGMVTPAMTALLFSNITVTGDTHILFVVFVILVIVTAATFLVTSMKQLLLARISTKVAIPLQAAFMMRALTSPAGITRELSAGDMGSRIGSLYSSLKILINMFLSMMLTAACSFACFFQMFSFAPRPAAIALGITVFLVLLYTQVIWKQFRVSTERMNDQAEESGLTYTMMSGIQKITLSGAESRAFSVWARVFQKAAKTVYNPPLILKIHGALTHVILLLGTIIMFYAGASAAVPPSAFYAFLCSYEMLTGALIMISGNAAGFADALPVLRILKPLMDLEPETGEGKEVVRNLKGNISLHGISFRYDKKTPPVLENLSIQIHSGECVAIVGPSGCGKSTLIRLLLGFEQPDEGDIFYDGKNLRTMDLTSLRRKIGTVLQNGDCFQGTIFSNITVSGEGLTEEDAWAAARIAGIEDDIQSLPLKMNTPIPDGGRVLSGGQKQRLLIARAVAPKPAVVFLDEATSALDNQIQKQVSDALDQLNCTRIVIAHRLSTVRNCDRILVMDQGAIIEEGTYEELICKNGYFAELVNRQRLTA